LLPSAKGDFCLLVEQTFSNIKGKPNATSLPCGAKACTGNFFEQSQNFFPCSPAWDFFMEVNIYEK